MLRNTYAFSKLRVHLKNWFCVKVSETYCKSDDYVKELSVPRSLMKIRFDNLQSCPGEQALLIIFPHHIFFYLAHQLFRTNSKTVPPFCLSSLFCQSDVFSVCSLVCDFPLTTKTEIFKLSPFLILLLSPPTTLAPVENWSSWIVFSRCREIWEICIALIIN